MPNQPISRVQSPLKDSFYSQIHRYNSYMNSPLINSRLTQKRCPIFTQTPKKKTITSSSNSPRKKIFENYQSSQQKFNLPHFSHTIQSSQPKMKQGDHVVKYEQSQIELRYQNSQSSENQYEGISQIKKRLFPSTPIKKIAFDNGRLQMGESFTSESTGNIREYREVTPVKSSTSVHSNEKTIVKFSYSTPNTKRYENQYNKIYQYQTRIQKPVFSTPPVQPHVKIEDVINCQDEPFPSFRNRSIEKEDEPKQFKAQIKQRKNTKKDIAKSLRQLHNKMSQQSKLCTKVDLDNKYLKEQISRLRTQNQHLKREKTSNQQLDNNFRNSQLIQKQNLEYKMKMHKAKNLLKVSISPQSQWLQMDQNLKSQLQQVIKLLQI